MTPGREPVLLDGGMGQELVARGAVGTPELWSAGALIVAPDVVRAVHTEYLAAGADVITTNTYATTPYRMARCGVGDRVAELTALAGRLAVQARDASGRDARIAGSLGPLRDSFRPERAVGYADALPEYRQVVDALADHVDLLICETMTTLDEARAARDAAAESGRPVWVAWTLTGGRADRLRSGETFATAVAAVEADAYLINCTGPEVTDEAIPHLVAATDAAVGAYANGFVDVAPDYSLMDGTELPAARDDLDPERYAAHAASWMAAGASVVGGCCEIGPAHIARLRRLIDDRQS